MLAIVVGIIKIMLYKIYEEFCKLCPIEMSRKSNISAFKINNEARVCNCLESLKMR